MNADDERERERAEELWSGAADPDRAELRAIQRRLEEEGSAAREAFVREAVAAGPAAREDEVIAALEEAMAEAPAPLRPSVAGDAGGPGHLGRRAPGGAMLSWRWIAGSVAAVLLAVVASRLLPEPPEPDRGDPLLLDDGGGFLTAPVGPVDAYDPFTWREGPLGGSVQQLRIWLGERPSGLPDFEFEIHDDAQWSPAPDQRARLDAADAIFWEVVEVDPSSFDEVRLGSASAWRSD